VLELCAGLSDHALDAIADLERRTVAVDGGRLKLEWGVLRSRPTDRTQDLLWWDADRLVGFVGLYGFGAPTLELAGMVDPQSRRQGIGTALLDAAQTLAREQGYKRVLLIVPRASEGGAALAARRNGHLEHSEFAMVLADEPADGRVGPEITVRDATEADAEVILALLDDGFGFRPDAASLRSTPGTRTVVVEVDGEPVGTARLTVGGDGGAVYGFVVEPARRGQGIGRQALREFCRSLRSDGARQVRLEVAVENERALGLYTSLGFETVTVEDYYELPFDA
jgi:ribosomal protein S18 acetylase RimI-like enzyme